MKHFLPLLFALLTTPLWSQTGNGVVLLTDASHTFTPTTVDSTTSFSFQLVNVVGVAQTVFFGALDAPFSMDDNSPVVIPSQDTIDVTIYFTPTDLGTFQDTISFVGSVFGSAELALAGDGIQVVLTWDQDTLSFDTTAIGQTSSQSISISSIGNGTGTITDIAFSSDIFSIDSASSAFTIPEGDSDTLFVVYAPINAGAVNEIMTLTTNDPNNPTITIDLTAVGISEVSGEICDITWTAENSPYTFVGDVIVPAGCSLNIDPGVQIIGNDYFLEVFGSFHANGTNGNEVLLNVGELISHTQATNLTLSHTDVEETLSADFVDYDYSTFRTEPNLSNDSLPYFLDDPYFYIYPNENSSSHIGKYFEDFSDNNAQGWTFWFSDYQGNYNSDFNFNQSTFYEGYDHTSSNSIARIYRDCCYSSSWYSLELRSPVFQMNTNEIPESIDLDYRQWDYWSDTRYLKSYIKYDDGEWIEIDSYTNPPNSWFSRSMTLTAPAGVQQVQFKSNFTLRYYGGFELDNFELLTSSYPNEDLPQTGLSAPRAAAALGPTMSTGGISLDNCDFTGDFHVISDSVTVLISNSVITGATGRDKNSHGIGIYSENAYLNTTHSTVEGHSIDGVHIESLTTEWSNENSLVANNGEDGIFVNGDLDLDATELDVYGNGERGINTGSNSNISLFGSRIQENGAHGIYALSGSTLDLDYTLIDDNQSSAITLSTDGGITMDNCRISGNAGIGLHSASPSALNHCNFAFNGNTGLVLTGNNFHTLNNSILWGNNSSDYTQIEIFGGVISTSYSTVQGRSSYGTTGEGQYYWGEGVLEADPLFADDDLHLEIFSPCVDGGQPWHQDAYMPFGLGGVRADMGMYGGPDNAYWGGEALPDGASALNSITDSPQDQGGVVGLTFGASFYDNSELVNNVTSYAFWRHYDPTGQAISTLDDGNWELIGEMPAQSFNGYAYQAATLGNTNDTGPFSSCYTVVAHTDDPDTYWYSNVMCGESVDNLAPGAPDLNGMPLEEGGALISWADPAIGDYAYTRIVSDAGFEAEVSADTLVVDAGALAGSTVTYTATHFDINGNESEPTDLTLVLGSAYDIVPLHAGWNLISLDRAPEETPIASLFGDLMEDNLLYVTGFDGGVSFYDPNGLPFLNTLFGLTPGYGYWVKVAQDDTLRVPGTPLGGGYLPTLDAGWNLIAYTAEAPLAPEAFFADLIADGDLAYLTGFDNGIQVFDPNGLQFLNTLTTLKNGYGYWLKTSADYAGLGLVDETKGANPNYVVLNGTSNLGAYAGQTVLVLDESGRQVAEMPILEGGYLMTTAVYGSETGDGLQPGAGLQLEFAGERIALDDAWTGDMAHLKLDVAFPIGLSVFPNPATDRVDLRWNQAASGQVRAEVFDATGKQVLDNPMGRFLSGWQQASIAVDALAPGHYTLHLLVDSRSVHQTALQRAE